MTDIFNSEYFLNLFQWCLPRTSTTTWTKKNNVPCDDGDSCTMSDTCKQGQCNGISFICNSNCQSCNGRNCSLHTGYGYVAGKCSCKIAGRKQTKITLPNKNACQFWREFTQENF